MFHVVNFASANLLRLHGANSKCPCDFGKFVGPKYTAGSILSEVCQDVRALDAFGQGAKALGAPLDWGWFVVVFGFEPSERFALEGDNSLMSNPSKV